jgi:quinol monooxygenase YgiN
MTIARQYVLTAAEGGSAALAAALGELAGRIRSTPGCEGVEILQDAAQPARFVFIEKWGSIEAHQQSADRLPKDAFSSVMAALGGKPDAHYLVYLDVG